MAFLTKTIIFLFTVALLFVDIPAFAVPPDFNADRRVNIKCPTSIDKDYEGQFELDGFKNTLKRLYHELDINLKASQRTSQDGKPGQRYSLSDTPNRGRFFVCHAKAFFPAANLESLFPPEKIDFQEVFFITEIDWKMYRVEIVRQRDRKKFRIDVADFEKAFLWYNALLDKQRAYIPVYGFLSLPGDAIKFPTIWNSWEEHKTDTATPPESLVDYDFYKILDYQDGYYLLGKDFNELDYRNNIEDFGIIGWVEKRYITLWRSRLYYHPLMKVKFFDDKETRVASKETSEINNFYVEHVYLKERLFNDIVERIDQESLHKFYTHFGFPQLIYPEYVEDSNYAKVFIPGAFTPRLMRMLSKSLKRNLNTFFLLDVSESMRPFADYVRSFNNAVKAMRKKGIGLRMNRVFTYSDSMESYKNIEAGPNFARVKRTEELSFIQDSSDRNYAEPLMRGFTKIVDEVESLQKERLILPLHEKLLFIITDAGANDLTEEAFAYTAKKTRDLNLNIYFIYPDGHGIRAANPNLEDTPGEAYRNLEDLIARYEGENPAGGDIIFRKFKFNTAKLQSEKTRKKDFTDQHRRLLGGITSYIDHIFKAGKYRDLPKDVVLYFSDQNLLMKMRKWSNRRIQVLNHVVKFITDVSNSSIWEERIAVPAKPVETYLRAIRTQDDITLLDLKKLVIINSLVSVDDIEKCRELYDYIKPLIEKKTFKTADAVFYKALTNKESGKDIRWNSALGDSKKHLGGFLSERGFHLNSFNQAVQRKFMYLKVGELYDTGN